MLFALRRSPIQAPDFYLHPIEPPVFSVIVIVPPKIPSCKMEFRKVLTILLKAAPWHLVLMFELPMSYLLNVCALCSITIMKTLVKDQGLLVVSGQLNYLCP